ncbi:MAG: 50S ribosomal protein L11 methyltransferase [Acidobacteriota bacterium]|nr:50S ribosomal protein L11 methyltransferase [Acidobacteriota bacterium]
MTSPKAYSLFAHGEMISDGPRIEAYSRALQKAIRPEAKVLDIGAGPGIFSLLACSFGAAHVFAIEPDDTIQMIHEFAIANGFADRITAYQALSTAVTLPERVDVIVSDLRGVLPLFEQHIPSIIDARGRFLKDGGLLIPQVDTLWAALVSGSEVYQSIREPWLGNQFDLDLSAAQKPVSSRWKRVVTDPGQLLCPAKQWATLDYRTIDQPNAAGELAWTIESAGTASGIVVWFDTELTGGIGFSNAPGEPELVYGQAFFPWPEPQDLVAGDRVRVDLRADLTGDDYTWSWRSRICRNDDPERPGTVFDQSTFYANLVSPEQLRRREANSTPALDVEGQIDSFILSQMDGMTTLGEIARRTVDRLPEHFRDWQEALTRVGELAVKYGK